jgi:hypothetical protein
MTSSAKVPEKSTAGDCQIAEIVQYTCEIEGERGMNCFPIPRIFRLLVKMTLLLLAPLTVIAAALADLPLKSQGW